MKKFSGRDARKVGISVFGLISLDSLAIHDGCRIKFNMHRNEGSNELMR